MESLLTLSYQYVKLEQSIIPCLISDALTTPSHPSISTKPPPLIHFNSFKHHLPVYVAESISRYTNIRRILYLLLNISEAQASYHNAYSQVILMPDHSEYDLWITRVISTSNCLGTSFGLEEENAYFVRLHKAVRAGQSISEEIG